MRTRKVLEVEAQVKRPRGRPRKNFTADVVNEKYEDHTIEMPAKIKGVFIPSYAIDVEAHGTGPWSGPRPADVDTLVQRLDPALKELKNLIIKKEIEELVNIGDTKTAHEVLKMYGMPEGYRYPLNQFARDLQNGNGIYQGAHCFYGAFRDAAGELFSIYYKKKGDLKPSDKHLRKQVEVFPYHVPLMRNGKQLMEPDYIDKQQPVGDVQGFARYEVINPPFNFKFTVRILVAGKFKEFLAEKAWVFRAIESSTLHRQGSRRSANFGPWAIDKIKEVAWSPWKS